MAARLITTAGAAAAGGAAALKYQDELWLAGLMQWAGSVVGGGSDRGARVPAAVAPATAPVMPTIHISTGGGDSGAMVSWRLATALGSGAILGVYCKKS